MHCMGYIYKCLHNYRSIANYISARNVLLIILRQSLANYTTSCLSLAICTCRICSYNETDSNLQCLSQEGYVLFF